MTNEEVKEIVKELMTTYDLTPEIEDNLKKIVDSIDERQGTDGANDRVAELEEELRKSKERYANRFLYGKDEVNDEPKDPKEVEEEKDEIDEEEKEKEYDDLFKED